MGKKTEDGFDHKYSVVPLKAVEQLSVFLLGPHSARGFVLAALFRGTDHVGHRFHHVHSPGWQLLQKDGIY